MAEVYCFTENECPGCPVASFVKYADILRPLIGECVDASEPLGPSHFRESVLPSSAVIKMYEATKSITPRPFFDVGDAVNRHAVGLCVELRNISKGEN